MNWNKVQHFLGGIFLLLLTSINTSIGQNTPEAAEASRFEAMVAQDSSTLYKVLHQELNYTHSNGLVETKKDFIHAVVSKKIIYQAIKIEQSKVSKYQKFATIIGICVVKGFYEQKPFEVRLRYLSCYVRKQKHWKLVAWQSQKM